MEDRESLDRYRSFVTKAREERPGADMLVALTIIEQLLEHIDGLPKEPYRGFQIGDGNTQRNTF